MASSAFDASGQGSKPIVFISATGPDTTNSMLALHAEGVAGPPTGTWIVGATEAAPSVVHSASELAAAVGYNSYLVEAPKPGTCAAMDIFTDRFHRKYRRSPTGGFAAFSYDAMLLTAAGLRSALAKNSAG